MKNQPIIMKNHENQPGTMKNKLGTIKNQPGTMKNHENTTTTIKTHLEHKTNTFL